MSMSIMKNIYFLNQTGTALSKTLLLNVVTSHSYCVATTSVELTTHPNYCHSSYQTILAKTLLICWTHSQTLFPSSHTMRRETNEASYLLVVVGITIFWYSSCSFVLWMGHTHTHTHLGKSAVSTSTIHVHSCITA